MHSTNYHDVFILVAQDSAATSGVEPPHRSKAPTVARLEYDMIVESPYRYTSDDVKFAVFAQRKGLSKSEEAAERHRYFSKGQPCFRASPLPKTYGWGVHSNSEGKIALVALGSDRYDELANNPDIRKVTAMRSRRA